jgi:hypothetical protein
VSKALSEMDLGLKTGLGKLFQFSQDSFQAQFSYFCTKELCRAQQEAIFHVKNRKPIWQKTTTRQGYRVLSYLQCDKGSFPFPVVVFRALFLSFSLKELQRAQGKAILHVKDLKDTGPKNSPGKPQEFCLKCRVRKPPLLFHAGFLGPIF